MAGDNEPGYADDQYFGPPTPVPAQLKPDQRYTGGYEADPKTGGGYRYNFKKLTSGANKTDAQPSKGTFAGAHYQVGAKFNQNFVQPVMLPPVQNVDTNDDPKTSDENGAWWIHESEGIPMTKNLTNIPWGLSPQYSRRSIPRRPRRRPGQRKVGKRLLDARNQAHPRHRQQVLCRF